MSDVLPVVEIPPYEPARGLASWQKIEPAANALDPKTVKRVGTNLQSAGLRAVYTARQAHAPGMKERFDQLPGAAFDHTALAELETLGWAAIYVKTEAMRAESRATRQQVPAALVGEATEQFRRMMVVAEYYLADDPVAGPEVRSIKAGRGHVDLANDLGRLAELFDEHHDLISSDQMHYQPGDAERARSLSLAILDHLAQGQGPTEREWMDRQARVWTLLQRAHDEVRATALWLLRHDPKAQARFLSLYTPPSSKATPSRSTPDAAPAPTPAPAEPVA